MRMTRRDWARSASAGVTAILGVARAQRIGQKVITGAWPLGDYARVLENRYSRPVTFETPVLRWRGHMRSLAHLPDGNEQITFITHSFVLPDAVAALDAKELTLDLLSRIVDAYHQSNPGFPRYRTYQSTMGFHIVPTDARDEAGTMRPTQSVLDAEVNVFAEKRTSTEHVQAVLAAVTEATTIPTRLDMPIDSFYCANSYMLRQPVTAAERPYMLFEWGAGEMSAREAFIDLLAGSATTMSWTMADIPDYQRAGGPMCRIGFRALTVNDRQVWFDRCTNCRIVPTQRR